MRESVGSVGRVGSDWIAERSGRECKGRGVGMVESG